MLETQLAEFGEKLDPEVAEWVRNFAEVEKQAVHVAKLLCRRYQLSTRRGTAR
jgi:hypothetical protein